MYNSLHIRSLRQAIEQIKKAEAVFDEYCTDFCTNCPLNCVCDWDKDDRHIEYDKVTDNMLGRYVDYYHSWENMVDRMNFKNATGIDPEWYDHNEDRSEI